MREGDASPATVEVAMTSSSSSGRKFDISLVFDGGSIGNPGSTYGSFLIRGKGLPQRGVRRMNWGHGTNNEAEYNALIHGLKELLQEIDQARIDPELVALRISGDSRLVLNQVEGSWKAKSPRMRELRDSVLPMIARFGEVRFVHQDRKESVRILGH
jgi:ribonuclease HI